MYTLGDRPEGSTQGSWHSIYVSHFAAQDSGIFEREIAKLTVTLKKKEVTLDKDELRNLNLSKEYFKGLPATAENGTVVTSGNSSVSSRVVVYAAYLSPYKQQGQSHVFTFTV